MAIELSELRAALAQPVQPPAALDAARYLPATLVDQGVDLFIGVQGGKNDEAAHALPIDGFVNDESGIFFTTGDEDLDFLLEATAQLCKGSDHNNMDDGIYWDGCREKVVGRLRQVPSVQMSQTTSLQSLRELALQCDASENGPEQLVFTDTDLLDFANTLTDNNASRAGHVLTPKSLQKWALGCGALEYGPASFVFRNAQLLSFGRTLVYALRSFQERVQPWMMTCFGPEISADKKERNHRFLEEAIELVQSTGCTRSEAHQLVNYVYGRPVGDTPQEVGGVMVTLAALCLAYPGLDMHDCGEVELARIWTKVEKIREKQAAKPSHSPLPEHVVPAEQFHSTEILDLVKRIHQTIKRGEKTKDHGLEGNLRCILDHLIPDPPDFTGSESAPALVITRKQDQYTASIGSLPANKMEST